MTKIELYNKAKEAYYSGNPILEDFEFDELEKELGLENKSYIGSKHNPSYTEKHPFIMGSLSKIQIHEKEGVIDWDEYLTKLNKYITVGETPLVISPKYDGCSFETIYKDGKISSISSRGDGEYGANLYDHLIKHMKRAIKNVGFEEVCYRGEVLIDKNIFEKKYSDFVNPRSFVAGLLNRDYTPEIEDMLNDLSIVIYDIRYKDRVSGNWKDEDYNNYNTNEPHIGEVRNEELPKFYDYNIIINNIEDFKNIYNKFNEYRQKCPFALDGIVIKPILEKRINNLTESRPKDCVAIKFIPMLEETEVVDIVWKVGKSGEIIPNLRVKPVIMDGKQVSRCNGFNYGWLMDNKVSKGTKVIMSLAGDIIPFCYKVTDTSKFNKDNINLPENSYIDGCHLMKNMTEEEKTNLKFIASVEALKIPHIGVAAAQKIFDYIKSENNTDDITDSFFGVKKEVKELPNNILLVSTHDISDAIGGKNAINCVNSFTKVVKQLSLKDIIKSCNFRLCGDKVAEQISNYFLGLSYDWASMASEGYMWALDNSSKEYEELNSILFALGKNLDDFKPNEEEIEEANNKIPVILTGEPNNYSTKAEFLNCHPEYRLTGSWKEVQILFTNSLDSNTGKMKKAREKNIKIELY